MNNKINKYSQLVLCSLFFLCALLIVGCSTTPKKPGEVDVLRKQAESWLESGSKAAGQGRFEDALKILTDTKRNAALSDDSSLLIRTSLSRGNVLYSLGKTEEAFVEWNYAIAEAITLGDPELLSVSKIYLARGNLIAKNTDAASVLNEVTKESANIKKSRLYIAFSWQVTGLANRALERYNEAEAAFKRSLDIHVKDSYLDNAAYDWYVIASVRSLSNNFKGAIDALKLSISYDRRIENSWGLAASYRAMGDVYIKDKQQSKAMDAYSRARSIYAALGSENEAAQMDKKILN